jgi:hypothetical protein
MASGKPMRSITSRRSASSAMAPAWSPRACTQAPALARTGREPSRGAAVALALRQQRAQFRFSRGDVAVPDQRQGDQRAREGQRERQRFETALRRRRAPRCRTSSLSPRCRASTEQVLCQDSV